MSKGAGFYLVWCPTGSRPPNYRHDTYQGAVDEAERLARKMPGNEFYVLGAFSMRLVDDMKRVDFASDEIPF